PGEQLRTVRGGHDRRKRRIVIGRAGLTLRKYQQSQIMVAEYRDGCVTQCADITQAAERVSAAIDQVADKPQTVTIVVKVQLVQQALECIQIAMQVANCVSRHEYPCFGRVAVAWGL